MIRKNNGLILLPILLLGALLIGCGSRAEAPPDETAAGQVQVVLTKVAARTLQNSLAVYGMVATDPGRSININLPYDSIVEQVLVRVGQSIKRGAPLLQVKATPTAHIAYVQAETTLTVASAALERSQRLLAEHLATQADVEAAHKAFIDAQAALSAQQTQANNNSGYQIRAAADATVVQLALAEGQQVPAGTTLMQLEPIQQRVVYLGVAPEQRSKIRVGQQVSVVSVFNPQQTFTSVVSVIHEAVNPATRLVEIVVPIPAQQTVDWLPAQQVTGRIIIGEENVLAVPRTALLEDERGTYLYRVKNAKAEKLYVAIGIEAQEYIAISKGLQSGDEVVISGNYELNDGMSVVEEKSSTPAASGTHSQQQSSQVQPSQVQSSQVQAAQKAQP